ncbi:MAG: hypothetical protein MJ058_08135 [Akkermansia sp.]|nr:hypothetical protein [Akkermansia sp.]
MKPIGTDKLKEALNLLHEQLELHDLPKTELVVCGGAALIATGLVPRTTRDVDIVALMRDGCLVDSEPLPGFLLEAAAQVGKMLNLPPDWLNNGPAIQFRMGFPAGFETRLHREEIGARLTVHYIDRIDQIHFKVFASVDRGGYHISDLKALHPTVEELYQAALWCTEQDVSEGFRILVREMFNQNGWKDVGERI